MAADQLHNWTSGTERFCTNTMSEDSSEPRYICWHTFIWVSGGERLNSHNCCSQYKQTATSWWSFLCELVRSHQHLRKIQRVTQVQGTCFTLLKKAHLLHGTSDVFSLGTGFLRKKKHGLLKLNKNRTVFFFSCSSLWEAFSY